MITSKNIFEELGRISVLFATLESELGTLLCIMVHKDEPMLAASVLERNSFAKTLELLEKVSQFKGNIVENRIFRLLKVVKPLRKRRNLYIHGCWNLSPKLLDSGKVCVTESKIEHVRTKNQRSWTREKEHTFSYHNLQLYRAEVMRALKMTIELKHSLAEED